MKQAEDAVEVIEATLPRLAVISRLSRGGHPGVIKRIGFGLVAVVLFGVVLGGSKVLQARMERRLTLRVLESQTLRIQEKVGQFDGALRRAEASVQRYAALVSDGRGGMDQPSAAFDRTFQRDADGSWRIPRARFNPNLDANGWIPPDVPLTDGNRRFYLHALAITRSFGLGAVNELMVNSWLLPLSNGMTAFWPTKPDYLYNAASGLDYRKTPWVTLTDPRINPHREPRWVGPEYDPAAQDWSLSVVAPFFRNGEWAGSVGHDMVVSKLVDNLFDRKIAAAHHNLLQPLFLVGERGQVLARHNGAAHRGERLPAPYADILRRTTANDGLAVVPFDLDYLLVARIPTLKAKAVYRVEGSWVRRSVQEELTSLQIAEAMILLLGLGSVLVVALKDGQARRQQQALLEARNQDLTDLTRRDLLTGLPNRFGLIEQANRSIERARRVGSDLLVVFLDLDRFKTINDSLGHDQGDELLRKVAARLSAEVRASDTVARLGGDEFVLVIEDLDDQFDAGHVMEKLLLSFQEPIQLSSGPLMITPSMGISLFPEDGDGIEALMRQADMAMYEVKAKGRNGWMFYTGAMNEAVQQRLRIENDLRFGLERDEFSLLYQPQWTIDRARVTGWEALIRWHQPQHGMIPPCDFIPVAEETGIINPIGNLVLRKACLEAMAWRRQGLGDFSVSINLSLRQFVLGDLQGDVEGALEASGLPPSCLELEITESLLMENPGKVRNQLASLKSLGVRLAIDDFGTGYSSLSYLSTFPIDRLKIDRSFVASSLEDPSGAAIVEAVIALAKSLGLAVIAEGVETEAQWRLLQRHGCQQIQGYLTGRPMEASAIAAFLERQQQSPAGVMMSSPPQAVGIQSVRSQP